MTHVARLRAIALPAASALALALACAAVQARLDAPAPLQAPAQAGAGLGDAAPRAQSIEGRVLRVHDGDSFTMRASDGRDHGVRIAGIDAPERRQPYANVSRQALREQIEHREVRVEVVKVDPYGRLVGNVFVDGHDIGLSMLRAGLAWHFVRYDADLAPADRRRYAQAESAAREREAGLWKEADPQAPWSFRKQAR